MSFSLSHFVRREILFRPVSFLLTILFMAAPVFVLLHTLARQRDMEAREQALLEERRQSLGAKLATYDDDLENALAKSGFNVSIIPTGQDLTDWYGEKFAEKLLPETLCRELADKAPKTLAHLTPRLVRRFVWAKHKWTVVLNGSGRTAGREVPRASTFLPPVLAPGQVDIGHELQQAFNLEAGGTVSLGGHSFRIRRCRPHAGLQDDLTIWMNLEDCQTLLQLPGKINEISGIILRPGWRRPQAVQDEVCSLIRGVRVLATSTQLQAALEARTTMEETETTVLEQEALRMANSRRLRLRIGLGLFFFQTLATVLLTGTLTSLNVTRRRAEIGTLTALGFTSRKIRLLFAGRFLTSGFAGGILAFVATLFFLHSPTPSVLCFFFAISLLASLPAGFLTAFQAQYLALRHDPATLLS